MEIVQYIDNYEFLPLMQGYYIIYFNTKVTDIQFSDEKTKLIIKNKINK